MPPAANGTRTLTGFVGQAVAVVVLAVADLQRALDGRVPAGGAGPRVRPEVDGRAALGEVHRLLDELDVVQLAAGMQRDIGQEHGNEKQK